MSLLGDRLRSHARDAADAPAIHDGERWWSFVELAAAAAGLGLGVGPGDVVAVAIDRGIEAVLAVAAAALAGAIPALVDPGDAELAARTLAALRPAAVLAAPCDPALPGARVIELDRAGRAVALPASPLDWQPVRRAARIAHILFTSGSTASGKGVVWSELRAGYDWRLGAPGRTARAQPSGIAAALSTSLGYHELVRSLYHGTSAVLLDAPFPAAIALAAELGVGRIKLTPTHVELLLATAGELPALRTAAVTSAPIAPDRMRALAARLPRARVCRSYGLTESGPATMVWLHRRPGKLHSVGRAVAYRRVTVRDEAGRMLPPGVAGEVVIELPMWDASCDGYLDADPELARRFDNGVLWTGDRGTIDAHGFLVLGARAAEILKVGGRSVGAPRIEEVLAGLPGVAELGVVGVPDRLLGEVPCAVFVPARGGSAGSAAEAAAELELRADELPRWFLARRELPRGPSGKLRRGALAEEAARWTRSFDRTLVIAHRPFPAFELQPGLDVVDGCPPAWLASPGDLDPCARVLALVARRPLAPLAFALVQAGAAGSDAARFVVGPLAVELAHGRASDDLLDVFAGELIVLAALLPGPRPDVICALPLGPRAGLVGAGFTELAGHPGWLHRAEGGAVRVADAAPRELAAAAGWLTQLVRGPAGAQRRSAGTS